MTRIRLRKVLHRNNMDRRSCRCDTGRRPPEGPPCPRSTSPIRPALDHLTPLGPSRTARPHPRHRARPGNGAIRRARPRSRRRWRRRRASRSPIRKPTSSGCARSAPEKGSADRRGHGDVAGHLRGRPAGRRRCGAGRRRGHDRAVRPTPSWPCARRDTMPSASEPWGSASSTTPPSPPAMPRRSTVPSASRSSIGTSITATARRTSSGGRERALLLDPRDAALSRAPARSRRGASTAPSSTRP